ncbi:MAG: pilus assembly protein [Azoarcus sp.]|jgi:type IV pilus assembly protein PilX|nr:pilus assembly protein [Azoarcus sp.]
MNIHFRFNRQRGATLIISMILLTIIALLTITSLHTTLQEERMSATTRDRDLAFQSAEAALRIGEAVAELWAQNALTGAPSLNGLGKPPEADNVCNAVPPHPDGLYVFPDPDCEPLWRKDVGESGTFWRGAKADFATSGLSLAPYYIVEYISGTAPCDPNATPPVLNCKRFRISASSETANGRAVVILQSLYATDGIPPPPKP